MWPYCSSFFLLLLLSLTFDFFLFIAKGKMEGSNQKLNLDFPCGWQDQVLEVYLSPSASQGMR